MSKKHNKSQPEAAVSVEPHDQNIPRVHPQDEPSSTPVSKALIWTFWGGVASVLIVARVLDYMLPGVPERVIERWLMLAFAAFLGVFLFKLK
jgi:hypothetical protein